MNRRKFLSWLGMGSAAVAVAPYALLNGEPVYVTETVCSCSGRSFWEGPCDYCRAHPAPPSTLGYADYSSFSKVAVDAEIDDVVSQTAMELGRQAGLSIRQLEREVYDGT
jgi:hypothetical protein